MMQYTTFLRTFGSVALLCLAGCSDVVTNGPEAGFNPRTRFPITVEPQMMTLRLAYNGRPEGLSSNVAGQLERFAADYLDHGSGAIAVSAPSRLGNAPNEIADKLVELGVPEDKILVGNQDDPASTGVKLTYIRYQTQVPACGDWSRNLATTYTNITPPNFGCATQHNLAAMVSDPRDLVSPRPVTPTDAARRLEVLTKYRKGETTLAEKSQEQSGAVSRVGGN